ncbi:OmpA family protein [Ponticaulis profundi]|uniref:OmpA family protein n=1 Tax=Ponticaulis profundi TaxID=2665222 RepID=A0ABW1S538_9PROT
MTFDKTLIGIFLGGAALAACSTSPPAAPPPLAPQAEDMVAGPPCHEENFQVYFASGQTTLDETARKVIGKIVESEATCELSAIEIEGHSDASGASDVNLAVSRKRAQAVQKALQDADLRVKVIEIIAMGETDALTSDGLATPMNRMVEVRFRK